MNPITLAQQLIQCPSITPNDAGCLDIIESILKPLGFVCRRLPFGDIDNLYARYGTQSPNLCFAGHTDVVPVVDENAWAHPPFAGIIDQDQLIGRGVADMKGAIAAFISAVAEYLQTSTSNGSISFILTSDEEGPGINGTCRVIEWLKNIDEHIDGCLVGEPTNPLRVGEMIKIGRRGSLNTTVTAIGLAGHIAYPENAQNPIPILLDYLDRLRNHTFDTGNELFDPSHLEISTIDVDNTTRNVIPSTATAQFNIRFNNHHTSSSLTQWLVDQALEISPSLKVETRRNGEAFYCPDDHLKSMVSQAIQEVTGMSPVFSTSGGTSDARFLKDLCPVIEFGLISQTAHQINECVAISEIITLKEIYKQILQQFFV